ncbi:MAG TPA: carboxypeptidase regulatory-like domain-containing protein [Pyrinomonadaceae bacterium]|nr:carboxypeptidase regulatory-like domain-containing protein [Pyrinomonadaceae bacterium]
MTAAGLDAAAFSSAKSNRSVRLSSPPPVTCTPSAAGLVNWWPGNGNASDVKSGNNATLFNGAAFGAGQAGQAFTFSGSGSYASVPASSNWAFGTGDFSIEFWMLSSSNDDHRPIINNRVTPASNNMWAIEVYTVANRVEFHSGLTVFLTATTLLTPSSWNHVAVTRNGSTLSIYINGVLSGSVANSTNFSEINDLQIGRDIMSGNDLGGRSFQGMLDEVSIYRSALSPTEIAAIYNAGSVGKCSSCSPLSSGMISWWPAENNANDISGANDGTVNGVTFTAGMAGRAFDLSGSGDYVQVAAPSGLPVGNAARTMMLWFRTPGTWSGQYPLMMQYGGTAGSSKFGLMTPDYGGRKLTFWGEGNDLSCPTALQPNTWYHGAVTYDGTTVRLYMNGQLENSEAKSLNTFGGSDFTIGRYGSHSNITGEWNGLIDEPMLFDRELSQAEIQAIVNAGSLGVCRSCTATLSGLSAWYKAENNALDDLGNYNGTLVNGATFATGKVGNAFKFDGIDDLVNAGNIDLASRSFSWDAWVKRSSSGTPDVIIGQGTANIGQGLHIGWRGGSNEFTFDFFNSTLNVADVPDGNWHHWAGSYDVTTGEKRIYKDGQLAGSNTGSGYSGTGPLWIGRLPWENPDWTGGAPLDGLMDEVEIFGRVVTQTEFRAIFQAGSSGRCDSCSPAPVGLTSWWAGDGNTLDGRGVNNGTLMNGAAYSPGRVGQGFSFDGTNDHVLIADPIPPSLQIQNEISIDAWIYLTEYPSGDPMFGLGMIAGSQYDITGSGASVFIDGRTNPDGQTAPAGHIHFQIGDGAWHVSNTQTQVPLNQWVHIAATRKAGQDAKIYFNGVSQPLTSAPWSGAITYNGAWFAIGQQKDINRPFKGNIDEVGIYNRALTVEEITRLVNAGSSGVCTPTATAPPTGVVGWWGGDGFVSDISGNANHAALVNGAGFAVGKVGQAFSFDGVNDYVEIPAASVLDLTAGLTLETWIYQKTAGFGSMFSKSDPNGSQSVTSYGMQVNPDGAINVALYGSYPADNWTTAPGFIVPRRWYHVALTWDGTYGPANNVKLYIDGALVQAWTKSPTPLNVTAQTLTLGSMKGPSFYGALNGYLDESTIYNRAITQAEIQSIVNAGLAGKLKQAPTSAPAPMVKGRKPRTANDVGTYAFAGDATILFPTVTASGVTNEIPLDPAGLPRLPLRTAGLTYDLATSAQYTGTLTVCFNLPSFTSNEFATLHILHLENGGWVDRTYASSAYPSLCAVGLTSLSPFAIVTTAPTAAELSIAGRVLTNTGRGIRGAFVTVTGTGGDVHNVPTGNLGRYIVTGLTPGNTYIVTVRSRRFAFAQPTQVITLNDNVTDADFIGSAGTGREQ